MDTDALNTIKNSEVRIYGDPILRKIADPVESIDDRIRSLIASMADIMMRNQGIGLAAPQVGESLRVITVDFSYGMEDGPVVAMINPEVLEESGKDRMEEGCLSVPNIREDVNRSQHIRFRFLDPWENEEKEMTLTDLFARVILHEIDHLNGVLFVDRIGSIKRQLLRKPLTQLSRVGASLAHEKNG